MPNSGCRSPYNGNKKEVPRPARPARSSKYPRNLIVARDGSGSFTPFSFGPKSRGSFRPRYVALYDRGSVLYDLTARDPRRGAKLRHALAGGWERHSIKRRDIADSQQTEERHHWQTPNLKTIRTSVPTGTS